MQNNKANILGVGIDLLDNRQVLNYIDDMIVNKGNHYVCLSNVHTIMMSQVDKQYMLINNNADLALPDGMPLLYAAKLLGYQYGQRICGRELMKAVSIMSHNTGWKHYYYGGKESVTKTMVENIKTMVPGIKIAGYYSPPFRPLSKLEEENIVSMINKSEPDILWVGLGAPKQEKWIAEHIGKINVPIMFAVGAAFDFLAGTIKEAPRWMQLSGLEWLYRFGCEPRRLWRRYIINNPKFLLFVFYQLTGLRKY